MYTLHVAHKTTTRSKDEKMFGKNAVFPVVCLELFKHFDVKKKINLNSRKIKILDQNFSLDFQNELTNFYWLKTQRESRQRKPKMQINAND